MDHETTQILYFLCDLAKFYEKQANTINNMFRGINRFELANSLMIAATSRNEAESPTQQIVRELEGQLEGSTLCSTLRFLATCLYIAPEMQANTQTETHVNAQEVMPVSHCTVIHPSVTTSRISASSVVQCENPQQSLVTGRFSASPPVQCDYFRRGKCRYTNNHQDQNGQLYLHGGYGHCENPQPPVVTGRFSASPPVQCRFFQQGNCRETGSHQDHNGQLYLHGDSVDQTVVHGTSLPQYPLSLWLPNPQYDD